MYLLNAEVLCSIILKDIVMENFYKTTLYNFPN